MFDNGKRYILVVRGSYIRAMVALERISEAVYGQRCVADALFTGSSGTDTIVHMRTDAWHEDVVRVLNRQMLCESLDITYWHCPA